MADRFGLPSRHHWERQKRRNIFRRFHKHTQVNKRSRLKLQNHINRKRPLIAVRELIKWFGIARQ